MARKLVHVDSNFGISFYEVSEEKFASSDGTLSQKQYAATLESFQKVLAELVKMAGDETYRNVNAAEFLRVHSVWLHNLAKTGFAVDYAQYRQQ
ncbi:MAG: hypothetical protein HYS73_00595 [Parcubacteria group bacterium]|nr:hypothetical protein [Parcubacteria group bacterium]MBI2048958.1 hypothetical protein [Parcubacteria group bacterium]